jgi:phosphatidylglycerol:prolipoprotein diacylglycerol transferase
LYPDIFSMGKFTLHAYGTALALSFLGGILLARRRAMSRGLAERDVMDLFQIIVISAIIGARFFFVIFHLDAYRGRWLHMFALWEGGLTLFGGILLCFVSAALWLRWRKVSFLAMSDTMAPSLGLGIMITRIGCFFNGCCYGMPTDSPVGVLFPANSEATRMARDLLGGHGADAHIHPAQLYSSLGGLVILVLLLALDRLRRPVGFTFANFLLFYGIHRFVIDQFRYYEEVMRVLSLSVNQWISIGFVVAGIVLHRRLRSRPAAA